MVFRELHNPDKHGKIKLKFIQKTKIKISDLISDAVITEECRDGFLNLEIDDPAGYRFLKYEIVE